MCFTCSLIDWVNAPGFIAVNLPPSLVPGGSEPPLELAEKPSAELCSLWDGCLNHPSHWASLVSRGWILEALEKRSPRDFEAWLTSGTSSPRPFYRNYCSANHYNVEEDDVEPS
jgi:hypothetical protein